MPVEQPQFIDTLTPEWPLGTDPRSDGDNHIRLIKQVLQNTFPALNGAVSGNPTQLNDLTSGVQLQPADTETSQVVRFKATDPAVPETLAALEAATPTQAQYVANPALAITWQAIADLMMPVGHIMHTKVAANPAERFGFGTWVAVSGYIIGAGLVTDADSVTQDFAVGVLPGNFHPHASQLAADQRAFTTDSGTPHEHGYYYLSYDDAADDDGDGAANNAVGNNGQTTGGGHHTHNGTVTLGDATANYNLPGHVVYVWERTA